MSAERQLALALKKQRLLHESQAPRQQLAVQAAGWQPLLAHVDRLRAGWRWLNRHPAVPVALLVTVVTARPRTIWRLLRWLPRGWRAWQWWQRLKR